MTGGMIPERWAVHFMDVRRQGRWIQGRMHHHPATRWTSIIDMDNDVHAGDYLAHDIRITVGFRFHIDIYEVVVDQRMQVDSAPVEAIEIVDLDSESADGRPDSRVGGRFWVLADNEDDESEDAEDKGKTMSASASVETSLAETPSGTVSTFNRREAVHRRTKETLKKTKPLIKPWIGPIPKVTRTLHTLSDFIPADWTLVTKKKRGKVGRTSGPLPPPPKGTSADAIRTARRARLKSLLGQEVGSRVSAVVGCTDTGYTAQVETQAAEPPIQIAPSLHDLASDREPSHARGSYSSSARVPRIAIPGFPSLGIGRATRIQQTAGARSLTMAGRGGPPPPKQGPPPPAAVPPARAAPPPAAVQPARAAAAATQAPGRGVSRQQEAARDARLSTAAPAAGRQTFGRGRDGHYGGGREYSGADGYGYPPRGQWGDDGYDAYGEGQHRGSSSTGGGAGYEWYNGGGTGRGFQGPPGNFVEGVAGPNNRYNRGSHRGFRGGRGGGRRPPPPRPPPPPVDAAAVAQAEPVATVATASPALPEVAVDTVRALAAVSIPVANTGAAKTSDGGSDKGSSSV